MLSDWIKQRYLAVEKKTLQGGEEISRIVLGPRTFNEIGHQNLTKFVASVCDFDYSEKMAREWILDYQGQEITGVENEERKG